MADNVRFTERSLVLHSIPLLRAFALIFLDRRILRFASRLTRQKGSALCMSGGFSRYISKTVADLTKAVRIFK